MEKIVKIKDLMCERSIRTYEYSNYLSKLHKAKEKKIKSNSSGDLEERKLKEYYELILNRKESIFEILYK